MDLIVANDRARLVHGTVGTVSCVYKAGDLRLRAGD